MIYILECGVLSTSYKVITFASLLNGLGKIQPRYQFTAMHRGTFCMILVQIPMDQQNKTSTFANDFYKLRFR